MGSRVKATRSDSKTAAAMVRPNWRKNWAITPCMKATGTNTAQKVKVVARTSRAIYRVVGAGGVWNAVCEEAGSERYAKGLNLLKSPN